MGSGASARPLWASRPNLTPPLPANSLTYPTIGFPQPVCTWVVRWWLRSVTNRVYDLEILSLIKLQITDHPLMYYNRRVLVRTIDLIGPSFVTISVRYRIRCAPWAAWNLESITHSHDIHSYFWVAACLWTFNDILKGKLVLGRNHNPDEHILALNALTRARCFTVNSHLQTSRLRAANSAARPFLIPAYYLVGPQIAHRAA